MVSNDPAVFQEFRDALGTRDPKTIATYLTTMRGFVAWLATQPGGTPFHLGLVTETAVRGYMDSLCWVFALLPGYEISEIESSTALKHPCCILTWAS